MKYKYYFKNLVDYIDNEILTRDSYNNFITEIKELNEGYNYSIYMFGSYLGFLIEKREYNDIDFIIMSEKILEINDLTQFFISFHEICKKYNVLYNLMYSTDKKSEDFGDNLYSGSLFKTGTSRVIRLYERIEGGELTSTSFIPLIGSDLFEGLMEPVNTKTIKKMQMGVKFYYPIKIQ
jgi:predicted nucleotidyltransferase